MYRMNRISYVYIYIYDPLIDAKDIKEFCRIIQLTEFFADKESYSDSLVKPKSCFKPPNGRNEFMDNAISTLQKKPNKAEKKISPLKYLIRRK